MATMHIVSSDGKTSAYEDNPSGIRPTEYKVVVRPIEAAKKSTGGIIIPEEAVDREQFAKQEGWLVAVSPVAFNFEPPEAWNGGQPKPGDRVLYAKYAGVLHEGKDGVTYRIINDRDIVAVLD